MDILNFENIISLLEESGNSSLLLGNGFSIAFNPIFNYNSLFEKAKEKLSNDSERVLKLFEKIGTTNFEACLKLLDDTQWVNEVYGIEEIDELTKDNERIKEVLIEVISENHLSDKNCFIGNAKINTYNFLSNFRSIFTLNYDLLLYWVLIDSIEDDFDKFCDGFGIWKIGLGFTGNYQKNNYYYLHGALHLFHYEDEVYKQRKAKNGTILQEIRNSINCRKYPMIITEGNWEKKLVQIKNNFYLNHCYQTFQQIEGTLTIFGFSMSEHDMHIVNAIKVNKKIDKIFISIYGNENDYNNITLFNVIKKANLQDKVKYFNSDTTNIWQILPCSLPKVEKQQLINNDLKPY